MKSFSAHIKAKWPHWVALDAPLAPLTSFGLGGPADVLACPDTEDSLADLLSWATSEGCDYYVLGGGSNILFPDEGYRGLIIRLGRGFNWVGGQYNGLLSAGAACSSVKVLDEAVNAGLSGLESLSGLPGRIGGAIKMNAGLKDCETGARIEKLIWFDCRGQAVVKTAKELDFSYRSLANLPKGAVIVRASWLLEPEDPGIIRSRIAELIDQRKSTQPQGWASAGCVFKNPPGESAGKIIEAAGLKGLSLGGAWVSPIHANFIVARKGAGAGDVWALINLVRTRIKNEFGLNLELEIETPGWDDDLKARLCEVKP